MERKKEKKSGLRSFTVLNSNVRELHDDASKLTLLLLHA